jgi:hypothetical protein
MEPLGIVADTRMVPMDTMSTTGPFLLASGRYLFTTTITANTTAYVVPSFFRGLEANYDGYSITATKISAPAAGLLLPRSSRLSRLHQRRIT